MDWLREAWGERYEERIEPLPGVEDGMSFGAVIGLVVIIPPLLLFLLAVVIPTLT